MFWASITNIADGAREKLIQNLFFRDSFIPCPTKIGYLRLAKAVISSLLKDAFPSTWTDPSSVPRTSMSRLPSRPYAGLVSQSRASSSDPNTRIACSIICGSTSSRVISFCLGKDTPFIFFRASQARSCLFSISGRKCVTNLRKVVKKRPQRFFVTSDRQLQRTGHHVPGYRSDLSEPGRNRWRGTKSKRTSFRSFVTRTARLPRVAVKSQFPKCNLSGVRRGFIEKPNFFSVRTVALKRVSGLGVSAARLTPIVNGTGSTRQRQAAPIFQAESPDAEMFEFLEAFGGTENAGDAFHPVRSLGFRGRGTSSN